MRSLVVTFLFENMLAYRTKARQYVINFKDLGVLSTPRQIVHGDLDSGARYPRIEVLLFGGYAHDVGQTYFAFYYY